MEMENVAIKEEIRDSEYSDEVSEIELKYEVKIENEVLGQEDVNTIFELENPNKDSSLDKHACSWNTSQDFLVNHLKTEHEPTEESIDTAKLELTKNGWSKTDIIEESSDDEFIEENYNTDCNRNLNEITKNRRLTSNERDSIGHFTCRICNYKGIHNSNYRRHILTHRAAQKLKFYHCDECTYKSTRTDNLKKHIEFTHLYKRRLSIKQESDLSVQSQSEEVKTFNCKICGYTSIHRCNYIRHILIHKDPREKKLFYCDNCTYNSPRKDTLKKHIERIHLQKPRSISIKPDPDVKLEGGQEKFKEFACELCDHRTKYKHDLKKHMLTHLNIEELKMFQCEICNFMTKRKENLKSHLLTHRDTKELESFSCQMCGFKTVHKRDLKRHSFIHKPPEEVKMYGCDQCHYKTKRKDSVKQHKIQVHGKVTRIACEVCGFESKQKSNLKIHMLKHKNADELQMFKCHECSYESKYKGCLRQHISKIHKHPQVEMVKCEF